MELGGNPDFSLAPLLPPSQPPFLAYRVVTKMEGDGSISSSFHYSDIRTANQWVSDNNKPIIGLQLFYYGMGMMAVKLTDVNQNVVVSSGECGQLLVTNQYLPVVSMECGYRDSNYKILGITNSFEGLVVEVKLCLVVNVSLVCFCRGSLRIAASHRDGCG